MRNTQAIAGILTTLIVVGMLGYIFREQWSGWTDHLPNLSVKEWFSSEEEGSRKSATSPKKSNSKKSKGKVSRSTLKPIDSFKGVAVYDNGSVRNVHGRNVTSDGYNLGLKYQCVEFVKRFYYQKLGHKMPNSYGNAKDFYDRSIPDGGWNKARGLTQYSNPGSSRPQVNDILVFGPSPYNHFGHVAIVSKVTSNSIEIVQQNPGPGNPSRESFNLTKQGNAYKVNETYVLGWLRQ